MESSELVSPHWFPPCSTSPRLWFLSTTASDSLGVSVGPVCLGLLEHGFLGLPHLCSSLGQRPSEAKATLRLLYQHGLLERVRTSAGPAFRVRELELESFGRLAKFCGSLGEDARRSAWASEAALAVEVLAERGLCTRSQIVEGCLEKAGIVGGRAGEGAEEVVRMVVKAVEELEREGFLVRVPEPADEEGETEEMVSEVKRQKVEAGETDASKTADLDEVEFLGIQYSRFLFEMRVNLVVQYVHDRVDDVAARIVRIMLQPVEQSYQMRKDAAQNIEFKIAEYSEMTLFDASAKWINGLSRQSLRNYIELLTHDNVPILKYKTSKHGEVLFVDIENIIKEMRSRRFQSIMRTKFGVEGARVFRLLSKESYMSERQISEKALIPEKKCRETLFKMMQENFVTLQEVPKTADRNPKKTIYLWKIDLDHVFDS